MKKSLFFFQNTSDAAKEAVQEGTIYEFADFRLIPADNLLIRNGETIPLTPKAFSTLVLLVKQNGHLVRKSELIEKIWADAYVEEAAVSRCVWTIRNALGEDSKSQRFIQTVPTLGYKFVADVTERKDHLPSWPDTNGNGDGLSPTQEFPSRRVGTDAEVLTDPVAQTAATSMGFKSWKGYAVAAIALAAVIAAVVYVTSIRQSTLSADSGKRIAVLPLKPIDVTNRSDILEIGVADALINQINSMKGFVARPLTATRVYTKVDQDPVVVGREQEVDHVIDSNYQLADGKIRITSQLINVASGQVEDSYRVETAAGNVFAIQDAVAAEIGSKLVARFGATIGEVRKRGTSNQEAYLNYLQGMFLYDQRKGVKAVENLDRAVALDPNYALAWAGKALAHRAAAIRRGADERREYESARQAIDQALALDPSLADAYSALCSNKLQYEYDVAGAEQACKRALVLEPNSPIAYQMYALFLNTRGRHGEAIAMVKAAIDLEPSSFYSQRSYANSLYFARRYDEARAQYLRLWERNRNERATYEWMIRTLDASGQEDEAFEWFVDLLRLDKVDEKEVERFQTIFREAGWLGVLRQREKMDANDTNYFRRAGVNAQIGDLDRAIEFLNKAYERRSGFMPILQVEPMLDPVRNDPRYAELVRRLEAK